MYILFPCNTMHPYTHTRNITLMYCVRCIFTDITPTCITYLFKIACTFPTQSREDIVYKPNKKKDINNVLYHPSNTYRHGHKLFMCTAIINHRKFTQHKSAIR